MSLSVVVVTYRRYTSLNRILTAWLNETADVWLCDCGTGEGFNTQLPVKKILATPDPGNKIRHAAALLTEGDYVIKADDDILPYPGLGTDFVNTFKITGPAILGVHGRFFRGEDYYHNTGYVGSKELTEPREVDTVGVITCAPREYLAMDLNGCGTAFEDLYWQMEKYRTVKKFVIVTNKFMNLPESKDGGRLCAPHTNSRVVRSEYYKTQYNLRYKSG